MLTWLSANLSTLLISLVLFAVVISIVRYLIRQKKQGIHPNDYLSGNVKMHLHVSLLQTNICRHNHIGYDRNMNGGLVLYHHQSWFEMICPVYSMIRSVHHYHHLYVLLLCIYKSAPIVQNQTMHRSCAFGKICCSLPITVKYTHSRYNIYHILLLDRNPKYWILSHKNNVS